MVKKATTEKETEKEAASVSAKAPKKKVNSGVLHI